MTAVEIEIALALHFNSRVNAIVPNVSWGMGLNYEADVVVLRPSGYAIEIEIKVTASDIKRDLRKNAFAHCSPLFRQLWFAVPENLKDNTDIPDRAGVLSVGSKSRGKYGKFRVETVRAPKTNAKARKWTDKERLKLLSLGCMRIWTLKDNLMRHVKSERLRRRKPMPGERRLEVMVRGCNDCPAYRLLSDPDICDYLAHSCGMGCHGFPISRDRLGDGVFATDCTLR